MAKIQRTITVDLDVWNKAGEMLRDVGLNRSAFIEITFRSFVRLEKTPINEAFKCVMDDLYSARSEKSQAKAVKKKPK
jgi:hypothetical protein